jgi:predicted short-subunit dehydrogenase-like oxidoreductase (DUF2520 family)
VAQADWIFCTVPDRAVGELARCLAASGALRPGQIVVHTSGVLTSEVLAPVRARGALALALHPMQTVAEARQDVFSGTFCTLEGDEGALLAAEELVRALGARPWLVEARWRPRLHAAAVLASNAVAALAAVAAEAAAAAAPAGADGRAFALAALQPLMAAAVDNLGRLGLPDALTGPVERGDRATVQADLAALEGEARSLYRAFLPALVRLAVEKGSLGNEAAAELGGLAAGEGWGGHGGATCDREDVLGEEGPR